MQAATLVLALCAAGVDVGWQPVDSGGLEYVIQLDADALDILASGREFISEVPVQLGAVSRCRLKVGVGPVPRKLPAVASVAKSDPPAPSATDKTGIQQVEHREPAKEGTTPGEEPEPKAGGPKMLASLTPEPGPLPAGDAVPLAAADLPPEGSWGTLIFAIVLLFASVSVNAFLAWLLVGQRNRYRALTARIRSTLSEPVKKPV